MIIRFIRYKISLILLIGLVFLLTSCVIISNPKPDIEVIKATNQYNTALFSNDAGNNGFYVKREVEGVIGCYRVGWDEETNKIDTTMIGAGELMFDVNNEHLKEYEITDFELLSVYINFYYYVYFSANNKTYEFILENNNSLFQDGFSYVNFREVNPLMDGFDRIITTTYDTVIIEKDEESILEGVDNLSLVNIHGMHYLYLNENKQLVYENISRNKAIKHIFIEEETEVVYSVMNNNYAIVLTSDNKVHKLQYSDLSIKSIDVVNPEYMVTTINNNFFAIVDDGKIKVYNYMLDLIEEITPVEPTSNIVGLCLSFEESLKNKRIVLTTAYLNNFVLYRTVDEIKLA